MEIRLLLFHIWNIRKCRDLQPPPAYRGDFSSRNIVARHWSEWD